MLAPISALAALERAADAECARIREVVAAVRRAEAEFQREKDNVHAPTPLNLSGRVCLDIGGEK